MSELFAAIPAVTIYTDGACSYNPGPGGWAYIIIKEDEEISNSGNESSTTTSNRMEITAVIKALESLKGEQYIIDIYSDSGYVVNSISKGWIYNWEKNNWIKSNGEQVLNKDLWIILLELIRNNSFIEFHLIKGHSTNKYNNKCDLMAVAQSKKNNISFEK